MVKKSRDYDHMAPNAGSDSVKKMAENHGADIHLSGTQHYTSNAMRKDWGSMPYTEEQHASGSMNYMSHKKDIAMSDAKKLKRSGKGVDNAS